jgi:WD40 repeat protein
LPQALALSPDDNTLATCHEDHSIHLWDVSEPKLREVLCEVKQIAEDVRSGKRKGPTEPAPRPRAILHGHVGAITAIAFHPDGTILASAGKDRTIKLWDVVTGEVRLTLEGHEADILAIAFTADGNTLVSGDVGGKVKLWRAAAGGQESTAAK